MRAPARPRATRPATFNKILDAGANDSFGKPYGHALFDVRLAIAEQALKVCAARKRMNDITRHLRVSSVAEDVGNAETLRVLQGIRVAFAPGTYFHAPSPEPAW